MKRECWWCAKTLVKLPRTEQQSQEHCPSTGCHWCLPCQTKRVDEIRTGAEPSRPLKRSK